MAADIVTKIEAATVKAQTMANESSRDIEIGILSDGNVIVHPWSQDVWDNDRVIIGRITIRPIIDKLKDAVNARMRMVAMAGNHNKRVGGGSSLAKAANNRLLKSVEDYIAYCNRHNF